jgi:hypothetical protein
MTTQESTFRKLESLIQRLRPLDANPIWPLAEQVKAFLFMIALFVDAIPVPEETVAAPGRRSGEGRIDMAWVDQDDGKYIAVFEIDRGVKRNSIRKLMATGCDRKYIISMGEGGAEQRMMGSPALRGTGIRHLVVLPTRSRDAFLQSRDLLLTSLVKIEWGTDRFEQKKLPK